MLFDDPAKGWTVGWWRAADWVDGFGVEFGMDVSFALVFAVVFAIILGLSEKSMSQNARDDARVRM